MSDAPGLPPLGASVEADARASEARELLGDLLATQHPPDDAALDALWAAVDAFHAAVFRATDVFAVRCTRSCSNCCSQMVFDVNAFEVDRIGRRLIEEGRADSVREAIAARDEAYSEVRLETPRDRAEDDDTWTERVAIAFWRADHPCTLLDAEGNCSVHDVRPWSCRRSFAGNDPELCRGAHARDTRRRFFTLAPYETFDEELAALDHWAPFDTDSDRLDRSLLRWLDARST